MKNEKKLIEAIVLLSRIDNNEAKESVKLIKEFMADNIPTKKNVITCASIIDKKNSRGQLRYIYHDNTKKMAVATDTYVLFASADEYIETKGNGLRDAAGFECENQYLKFPNWQSVIPQNNLQDITFDAVEVIAERKKNCQLYSKIQNTKTNNVKVYVKVGDKMTISYRYISLLLAAGLDGWQAHYYNNQYRCYLKQWDGKLLLIMGVNYPEDDSELKQNGFVCNY